MCESEAASTQADLEALKALEADAPELERIVRMLNRLNLFEAIGFVGQEVMHSRFLAFLLDPNQNHGLEDLFLKKLLREAQTSSDTASLPIPFEHLDEMDLGQTIVRREHQHIDILLTNETYKLAVIIENKVWTTEHSDQLNRYYRIIESDYPGWDVLGLYLTPYGDAPSHHAYLPLSFRTVCEVMDSVTENREYGLHPTVRMSIEQYTEMLRRNIVGDPEVSNLSRQIYDKHRRALDLIFEHRPDSQAEIRDLLIGLIRRNPTLALETRGKQWLRFAITDWDTPVLMSGSGWTSSGRMLLFEFANGSDHLQLVLCIGPGPAETRKRLFEMALGNQPPFEDLGEGLLPQWNWVYRNTFLEPSTYGGLSREEREQEVRRQWDTFLDEDLPRIDAALKRETWIWESVEPDEGRSSQGSRFVWGEGDIEITKRSEHEA